ncbi:MAG: hypothetical protein LBR10_05095 [Prevotellaceae bacterium]|jgi:hypothetical protein|nr:hypothetical protein [Prevotellaceae bacterium]
MKKDDLKGLKNRIDWFCKNRINAFSPTISPAPKSPERNEIESIDGAIRYFFANGVREIVAQRKYMGSYCDIYLHKNPEDTFFVSRNGYKISHIDLNAAKESCGELHKRFDWTNLALVIIQSEMMPWSILGKGLIEDEFIGYLNVHQNHCNYLKESDLYRKIALVKESPAYREFQSDKTTLTDKELSEKYPVHIIRQYESLAAFQVLNQDACEKALRIYEQQISHFGREGAICFKAFNILKKVFDDGSEQFVNDNLSYSEVNDDEFLHLDISTEDALEQAINRVYEWFDILSQNMEEGIVIKPRRAFIRNLPPALKVRNNDYLTMIYGIDFQERYDYYLNKRSIKNKLECSVNDWMLNWEMLKINYKDIHPENYLLKNLIFDRIMGEKAEETLDIKL